MAEFAHRLAHKALEGAVIGRASSMRAALFVRGKSLSDFMRHALDELEERLRRLVGLSASLLPVAKCCDGNSVNLSEHLLRKPECHSHDAHSGRTLEPLEVFLGERLRIRIRKGSALDFLFGKLPESFPISFVLW